MVLTRLGYVDENENNNSNNNTSANELTVVEHNLIDNLQTGNIKLGNGTHDNLLTGNGNVIIGENTGDSITVGDHNILLGQNADVYDTSTDVGIAVGISSKAHYNSVAVGAYSKAEAISSMALGTQAEVQNTHASICINNGTDVLQSQRTGSLYIKPINETDNSHNKRLVYNSVTYESMATDDTSYRFYR